MKFLSISSFALQKQNLLFTSSSWGVWKLCLVGEGRNLLHLCTFHRDLNEISFMSKEVKETRSLISELCRQFYNLGWVSGAGGSITMKVHDSCIPKPQQLILFLLYCLAPGVRKKRREKRLMISSIFNRANDSRPDIRDEDILPEFEDLLSGEIEYPLPTDKFDRAEKEKIYQTEMANNASELERSCNLVKELEEREVKLEYY